VTVQGFAGLRSREGCRCSRMEDPNTPPAGRAERLRPLCCILADRTWAGSRLGPMGGGGPEVVGGGFRADRRRVFGPRPSWAGAVLRRRPVFEAAGRTRGGGSSLSSSSSLVGRWLRHRNAGMDARGLGGRRLRRRNLRPGAGGRRAEPAWGWGEGVCVYSHTPPDKWSVCLSRQSTCRPADGPKAYSPWARRSGGDRSRWQTSTGPPPLGGDPCGRGWR
jgi:hypothetical protein